MTSDIRDPCEQQTRGRCDLSSATHPEMRSFVLMGVHVSVQNSLKTRISLEKTSRDIPRMCSPELNFDTGTIWKQNSDLVLLGRQGVLQAYKSQLRIKC